jgi:hypothetical protein
MKKCLICSAVLILFSVPAFGATVGAWTEGTDNYVDPEFYGVEYMEGRQDEYIGSITYDITVVSGAFFDFDGDACFGNATYPVLATLVGLNAADITWEFLDPVEGFNATEPDLGDWLDPFGGGRDPLHPARLVFHFAAGSFGVGDSFTFGADTDWFVSDPAPGSVFGAAASPFTVTLETGPSETEVFTVVSDVLSVVTVIVTDITAAEPSDWSHLKALY